MCAAYSTVGLRGRARVRTVRFVVGPCARGSPQPRAFDYRAQTSFDFQPFRGVPRETPQPRLSFARTCVAIGVARTRVSSSVPGKIVPSSVLPIVLPARNYPARFISRVASVSRASVRESQNANGTRCRGVPPRARVFSGRPPPRVARVGEVSILTRRSRTLSHAKSVESIPVKRLVFIVNAIHAIPVERRSFARNKLARAEP